MFDQAGFQQIAVGGRDSGGEIGEGTAVVEQFDSDVDIGQIDVQMDFARLADGMGSEVGDQLAGQGCSVLING
jgi:hypothetical protein